MDLARLMFGAHGPDLVGAWLDVETDRVDDAGFARQFADHIHLPGVSAPDYNHRLVRTGRGGLLGGIRFYGRDVTRPFVEVIGHDFSDLGALAACVASEWAAFTPRYLRLHVRPDSLRGPGVLLDHTIHVARYRDMAPPRRFVELTRFASVGEAVAMVAARYAVTAAENPALRRNIRPATADDLAELHAADRLRAARVADATVGLLAAAPGAITWIEGDEIMEEVVDAGCAGRGIATEMQAQWARLVCNDADRLLIGTIDRHNGASRRSAERAGRPRVLETVFVDLGWISG